MDVHDERGHDGGELIGFHRNALWFRLQRFPPPQWMLP